MILLESSQDTQIARVRLGVLEPVSMPKPLSEVDLSARA